jgi:hypothetical protein
MTLLSQGVGHSDDLEILFSDLIVICFREMV